MWVGVRLVLESMGVRVGVRECERGMDGVRESENAGKGEGVSEGGESMRVPEGGGGELGKERVGECR